MCATSTTEIARLSVTALDDLHLMTRVRWDSRYVRRKDGAAVRIEFENLYFLHMQNGEPKILTDVTGDEAGALKENGLT